MERKSIRKYQKEAVSLSKLSSLLYYSAGLKINKEHPNVFRFYPSAGARFPLEIYLVSLNTGLEKGIYHYHLKSHSVELLKKIKEFDSKKYFKFSFIKNSAGIIIITAIFKRMMIKYGDLGYRYVMMECGHVAQNIHLTAAQLGIGCCGIGGFIDDNLNKFLDIDGITEASIYAISFGFDASLIL